MSGPEPTSDVERLVQRASEARSQIFNGEADYDILYIVPARDTYPHGDLVGIIEANGVIMWASWHHDGELFDITMVVEREAGIFPSATAWMLENNDAVPNSLKRPTTSYP